MLPVWIIATGMSFRKWMTRINLGNHLIREHEINTARRQRLRSRCGFSAN
jgi:hypothetical protein